MNVKNLVEVQKIHGRNVLCLFDLSGRCLHWEKTLVSFGALFGPEVGDLDRWRERALAIVESKRV